MRKGLWWAMLACFLLGSDGCAHKAPAAPEQAPPRYLMLDDGLSSDVLVCVPLVLASEKQSIACVPIDFVRWFLRSQQKG